VLLKAAARSLMKLAADPRYVGGMGDHNPVVAEFGNW
jgi:hypothetical protein